MFTQSCIIRKNTKELVEKLEKMGYKYADNGAGIWLIPLEELNYLGVNLYSRGKYMGLNGLWSNTWFDCGMNEELFLALAALRDDTNEGQWFVYPESDYWFKCYIPDIEEERNSPFTRMSCQSAWFYKSIKQHPKNL